ncbi:phospholipid phosphatase 3-like [Ptychodera flava]|uniref:phospholipid phosphatase 3-like n=1 Tax=Ptychodera flava TaxID=63121 RepID=UPI00396A490C
MSAFNMKTVTHAVVNFCMFAVSVALAWKMDEIMKHVYPNRLDDAVFDIQDPNILYSYKNSISWSNLLDAVVFITIPILVIGEGSYFVTGKRSLLSTIYAFCQMLGTHLFVSCWLRISVVVPKAMVVKPRPHFLETCNPDLTGIPPDQRIIPFDRCTNTFKKMADASDSWPSGHAALAFFAAVYLMIYIKARMPRKTPVLLTALIQVICISAAYIVCMTRIADNRHFFDDVLMGVVIGVVLGVWAGHLSCLFDYDDVSSDTKTKIANGASIHSNTGAMTTIPSKQCNGAVKMD